MADPGDCTETGEEPALLPVAGAEGFAGRIAATVRTRPLLFPEGAREAVHVRRGPPDILDDPPEPRHPGHPGRLADDRFDAPALDDPALVMGQGAERASPE